jgi:hypothetical protein
MEAVRQTRHKQEFQEDYIYMAATKSAYEPRIVKETRRKAEGEKIVELRPKRVQWTFA